MKRADLGYRYHRRAGALAATLTALLAASSVAAQTAGQIAPPTFAPPPPQASAPVVIPQGVGPTAPAGADTTLVTLGDVVVDGAPVDPADVAELRIALVGHAVTVAQVFASAHALETSLARSGQALTRVVVPAQTLTSGAVLHLQVVAGFIEAIDTSQLLPRVRRRIAAVLRPLVGVHGLTLKALERRLLLAADTPGVTLRSALSAGTVPGATVLMVEATARPVTGFVTIDNTLPRALGREALGVGVDLNSIAGLGEDVYLRASGDVFASGGSGFFDGAPRNRALAGGVILPIGDDGLTANVEGTDARTAASHDSTVPGFGSIFRRVSGRVRYPFIRSRALTIAGQATIDLESERVRIIDPVLLPISRDRLRIVRLEGDITSFLPGGGVVTANLRGSKGLRGLGARTAADAVGGEPLSRQGADADFTKLELFLSFDQPLARHLALALRGHAQTSFGDPLVNAEQIGLATPDGLSTFASGTVLGDSGYVGRAEVRAPFVAARGGGSIAAVPYLFGAYGGVRFEQPTVFERRTTDLSAFGVGVRLVAAAREGRPSLSTGLEYGRAHREGTGNGDRFTFTVIAQF